MPGNAVSPTVFCTSWDESTPCHTRLVGAVLIGQLQSSSAPTLPSTTSPSAMPQGRTTRIGVSLLPRVMLRMIPKNKHGSSRDTGIRDALRPITRAHKGTRCTNRLCTKTSAPTPPKLQSGAQSPCKSSRLFVPHRTTKLNYHQTGSGFCWCMLHKKRPCKHRAPVPAMLLLMSPEKAAQGRNVHKPRAWTHTPLPVAAQHTISRGSRSPCKQAAAPGCSNLGPTVSRPTCKAISEWPHPANLTSRSPTGAFTWQSTPVSPTTSCLPPQAIPPANHMSPGAVKPRGLLRTRPLMQSRHKTGKLLCSHHNTPPLAQTHTGPAAHV